MMASSLRCPLCEEGDVERLQEFRRADLIKLYSVLLGSGVRAEFAGLEGSTISFVRCMQCDIRFFTPTVVGSERLYELLQRFPWYYQDAKSEYDIAARYVGTGESVLEIGCGKAAFFHRVTALRYTGLEVSAAAQQMARGLGANVLRETVEQHARLNGGRYDVVASFQVLEHVAGPGAFLRAAVDCVRPGGRLIVSVPSEDSYLAAAQNYTLNMPPHHQTRWTDCALVTAGTLCGLEVVDLHHERLADEHCRAYVEVLADSSICRTLNIRRPMVDCSLATAFRRRVSAALGRVLERRVRDGLRPVGNSVVAVFSKPASGI
jgi:SAM-dependent methyltransferase